MVFVNAMQYTKVAEDEHLENTFDDTKASIELHGIEDQHHNATHLERGSLSTQKRSWVSRRCLYVSLGVILILLCGILGVLLFFHSRIHYGSNAAPNAVPDTTAAAAAAAAAEEPY
jgi:hypothetical protein